MISIEQRITSLLDSQFPNFIRDDAPLFVAFLKGYYQWMEQNQETLGLSRRLMSLRDIDTTVESFLTYFRNKYLQGLPGVDIQDERFLIKHIADLYGSKGTERAIKLLFRALYNEQATVYLPSQDIFKPSHGTWVRQNYIELAPNDKNAGFVGKQIRGLVTGTTAFVENIVKRRIAGRYLDVAYLSGTSGTFKRGEQVDLTTSNSTFSAPTILGSLTSIEIVDGGQNFAIGDVFNVTSTFGKQGKAQVTSVVTETGVVNFTVNNGGWGYSLEANAIISDRVLVLANVQNASANIDIDLDFEKLETVQQPKYQVYYNTSTNNSAYASGANVTTYHANNSIKAQGRIINQTTSNTTAGFIIVFSEAGGFANNDTLYTAANAASANIANSTNVSANGTVMGSLYANSILSIGVSDTQGTFLASSFAPIIGATSNTRAIISEIGSGEAADFYVSEITNEEAILVNSDLLAANNADDIPYMDLVIETDPYKFPKLATANVDTVLLDALTFVQKTIGTIATIGGVNRGQDYTADPFVLVKEPLIAAFSKKDYYLHITNPTATFVEGEIIEQTRTAPVSILTISGVTGANSYEVGELVYQANSTVSPQAANGTIAQIITTGASVTGLVVADVQGTFTNNVSYVLRSQTSSKNAAVSNVSSSTIDASARGLVDDVISSNSTLAVLDVRRISLANNFIANSTITGRSSGAEGTLVNIIAQDPSAFQADLQATVGLNAIVQANVQTSNNAVANLLVIDSGFGYLNKEIVTLTKSGSAYNVTGIANVFQQGEREGFYSSTRGFLSADKFIHDNDFYQEYSYQIQSGVSYDQYRDIVKRVLHVAGTKFFGQVNMTLEVDASKQENDQSYHYYQLEVSVAPHTTPANGAMLTTNTVVYQSNGSANVFFGVVVEPLNAIITLDNSYNSIQNAATAYALSVDASSPSGTVTYRSSNTTANTSMVTVSNLNRPFPLTTQYGVGFDFWYVNSDNAPRVEYTLQALNTVVIEHTSGQLDHSLPLLSASGSVNVEKVTVRLEHK